jgi:hypothetical protein
VVAAYAASHLELKTPSGYRPLVECSRLPLHQARKGSTPRWVSSPLPAIVTEAHDLSNHWNFHFYRYHDKGLARPFVVA